jgi:HSP20 family molecular chaperone IbpA
MTNYLTFRERLFPTDLMFRNLFDSLSEFTTAVDAKIKYPLNIIEKSDGLEFQFAVIGINKEDIEIEVESGDTLRVTYDKPSIETAEEIANGNYIVKNIANRSFNLAWRISPKYNLGKLAAEMADGLLTIKIPLVPETPTQIINIK